MAASPSHYPAAGYRTKPFDQIAGDCSDGKADRTDERHGDRCAGDISWRTKFPTADFASLINPRNITRSSRPFRAYDFHRHQARSHNTAAAAKVCHRLILDGLVNGTLHIAGDL